MWVSQMEGMRLRREASTSNPHGLKTRDANPNAIFFAMIEEYFMAHKGNISNIAYLYLAILAFDGVQ